MKHLRQILSILLTASLGVSVVSCDHDPVEKYPSEICGAWIAQSYEYYINGEYSKTDNPNKQIYVFDANGTYCEHLYSDYDEKLTSFSSHNWKYNSGSRTLMLWGSTKYEVLEANGLTLKLKNIANKDIYSVFTYRKLSQEECEIIGIDKPVDPNPIIGIPSSITKMYLHLYFDDSSRTTTTIYHLTPTAATFDKGGDNVYYTPNYGPSYTYNKVDSRTVKHTISYRVWAYMLGQQQVSINESTAYTTLTFDKNSNVRGTFEQTIGLDKNTKKDTGRFYLGNQTDPKK